MILALALLLAFSAPVQASVQRVRSVAGGAAGDFMSVNHVRIAGTQREIGRSLALLARERHGFTPPAARDPRRTAAQRRYFERNDAHFLERMRGAAEAFGLEIEDDRHELASLAFGFGRPGCSVVYYPPATTALGHGVLSRNFDFTTGTFEGRQPGPGEQPVCASPYVLELLPDQGFASLSVCAYDLLGGVVDGINSEGLVIALLADDEASARGLAHPSSGPQAGFDVLQIGRHLLETCADVEQAKAALLEAKLYYGTIPCHYILADARGRSFVWENSPATTVGYAYEGGDEPLVTTNFLRYLHPDLAALPDEPDPRGFLRSFCTIQERLAEAGAPYDLDEIRATSAAASPLDPPPPAPWAAGRTLWHALYFPEGRRVEIDFYLGEERSSDGGVRIRRSGYVSFALEARVDESPQSAAATR